MAYLPRNSGWYRKHFTMPSDWAKKSVWLYIEGSFHATTSYLNGVQIGYHQAGYTSFWLRLDNVTGVQFGEKNVLALKVDATFGTGWWYEGGGLIRHQYLVATDTTHLQPDSTWSYATDIKGGSSTASATMVTSAEVTNHGKASTTATVRATITDPSGTVAGTSTSAPVTVAPGATVMANTSKAMTGAKVWSVKDPALYTVVVDLLSGSDVIDTYNYSVGVRTLKYDTKGLHVNGESVKVRAFCDHSNFAGVGGAVPDRVNLYRVQMLRSVGANAWRMVRPAFPPFLLVLSRPPLRPLPPQAHNPPIPARLDFMDRLGKWPQHCWHLGCIILKMPAISCGQACSPWTRIATSAASASGMASRCPRS